MRALLRSLLLAIHVPLALSAYIQLNPRKLGEVFQVYTKPGGLGSCHNTPIKRTTISASQASNPIFDSSRDLEDRGHNVLNNMWYQAYTMVIQARETLEDANMHWETAKLLKAFFGIVPESIHSDEDFMTGEVVGPRLRPVGFHKRKLRIVEAWFQKIHDFMENARPDNQGKKPLIFCDGNYLTQQFPTDVLRDKNGNDIIDKNTGKPLLISESEKEKGREAEDYWYYWWDTGTERGYLVEPKLTTDKLAGARSAYPIDERTGQPNPCLRSGTMALVLQGPEGGVNDHMILCPQGIVKYTSSDNLDTRPEKTDDTIQGKGWGLENMQVAGMLILHELIHIVRPYDGLDHRVRFAIRDPVDDPDGQAHPDFPLMKDGFRPITDQAAAGPMQSMTLALWELAYPETEVLSEIKSIRTPEVYAQFARTLWLTVNSRQSWATGISRPWESPFALPEARIPEVHMIRRSHANASTSLVEESDPHGIRLIDIWSLDDQVESSSLASIRGGP